MAEEAQERELLLETVEEEAAPDVAELPAVAMVGLRLPQLQMQAGARPRRQEPAALDAATAATVATAARTATLPRRS